LYYDNNRAPTDKIHNNYKNTSLKLLKSNTATWFLKICKTKQLTPKYFSIKPKELTDKTGTSE
jgi:hypothetical protein